MTTSRRDIITGAVFGIGAIVLFAVTSGYPVREGQALAVSPGFYPNLLAALLALLSLLQISTAIFVEMKGRKNRVDREEQLPPIWKDRNTFTLFCITLVSLVIYPLLTQFAGFAITGFIFLGVLIYTLSAGNRKGKALIFVGVVTLAITLLTFLVFRLFLKIPFPSGIFSL